MRKFTSLVITVFGFILPTVASNFKADKEITISTREFGDFYLAGENVTIESVMEGDLVIGAKIVNIEDSVFGDLMIGAERITVRGYLGDDARLAGSEIIIDNVIEGDLIVFAGNVRLTDRSSVMGDVVCYGGEINIYGDIRGNLRSSGGKIRIKSTIYGNADIEKAGKLYIDGQILGNTRMAAESIEIGEGAYCEGNVVYWSGDGQMDLKNFTGNATWAEDMKMIDKNMDWSFLKLLLGVGFISYTIIFIVSAFLILLLFERLFSDVFASAAKSLKESFIKSFGYGMIYFIGVPIACLLLFILIIGIPLAAAGMALYFASLLFTSTISALCLIHYIKNRNQSTWTYWQTIGYALLVVVILKLIFIIPFIGAVAKFIVVGGVYGALILVMFERKKADA